MIENMQPGRELDALVAEKIMGWTDFSPIDPAVDYSIGANGFRRNYATDPNGGKTWFPLYSTDISAAWEVVEEMRKREDDPFCIDIETCLINYTVKVADSNGYTDIWIIRESAPHAVCLAALLALSEEEQT